VILEITILEIEGGRVRLGFAADAKMPIHRREVWERICNGNGNGNGNGHVEVVSATAPQSRRP
jgi:carbon storage regulator CsrA